MSDHWNSTSEVTSAESPEGKGPTFYYGSETPVPFAPGSWSPEIYDSRRMTLRETNVSASPTPRAGLGVDVPSLVGWGRSLTQDHAWRGRLRSR